MENKEKNFKHFFVRQFLPFTLILSLTACSSIQKADIASTENPTEIVAQLQSDIRNGHTQHYDVLASKDLRRSEKYLKSAKEKIKDGRNQEKVFDDLRYAKAYFDRAQAQAEARKSVVSGILMARQDALNSGARDFPTLRKEFRRLDEDMRSASDNFVKNLSPSEFSELQQGYLNLELDAIKSHQLGKAYTMISSAVERRAKRYTPQTLARAQTSVRAAENTIATDRHNPESFKNAVAKANADAALLVDIINATKQGDRRVDERTATKLVVANRRIQNLDMALTTAQNTMGTQSENLSVKERELQSASSRLQLQTAIESARREFNPDEAEAFQQGDRLLIRLKAMKFPVGRSDLPAQAIPLLAKVRTIAGELHPKEIIVSGHTDSTGSAALNQSLSQERAESVAQYFRENGLDTAEITAQGFGFKRPIASNKSRSGRAQNRRVDVVIVPAPMGNVETQRAFEPSVPGEQNRGL